MSTAVPDHHDAELVLRVYELRREAVMRESRNAIHQKFWPKSYEDVKAILMPDHPLNAALRQVTSYWEMVYGFARHGIISPDFLLESNNGEGLVTYAKIKPYLEQLRKEFSPTVLQNCEWITLNSVAGKRFLEMFHDRLEMMRQTMEKKKE